MGPERLLPGAVRRQSLEMAAGRTTILVVWRDLVVSIIGERVNAALLTLDGEPLGDKFEIFRGSNPRVAFDGVRYVVVGSLGTTISAQAVDESGALLDAPFTITDKEQTVNELGFAAPVPGAIARTVVTWPESTLRAGTIFGGALTSNVVIGSANEVVAGGFAPRTVAVAMTPAAQTLIARVSTIGQRQGVHGTIADGALMTTAAVTLDSQPGAAITDAEDDVDVAASDDGFAVVWSAPLGSATRSVRFALVGRDGSVSAKQLLAPTGASPRVVWTGAEFLVVWRQPEGGVYGAALGANGNVVADPFLIAPPPAGVAGLQALTAVPGGGAVVAYATPGTAAVRTIVLVPFRRRAVK